MHDVKAGGQMAAQGVAAGDLLRRLGGKDIPAGCGPREATQIIARARRPLTITFLRCDPQSVKPETLLYEVAEGESAVALEQQQHAVAATSTDYFV